MMRKVYSNMSFALLSNFLLNVQPGSLLIYDDFVKIVNYGCARSTVDRLCDSSYLFRISPGIFVRMNSDGTMPKIDILEVAKAMAKRNGSIAVPGQKTIEALNAGLPIGKIKWQFYTTGSSRVSHLYNGIEIHFRHTDNIEAKMTK